ncbi:hypothetical protein L914_10728 [Phytophthora nicotianae]|uniref:Uncharacterized protein n=4 Tax=Phytophthora nicotianae TaxID=4792 RepID=V9EXU7_PHYNI|nr:hypothetical protein F443_11178 [Phytophthora nicotianae P1569]ETM43974.1 hypothetical protein L914_10728 [Phytophthora nicotianae]
MGADRTARGRLSEGCRDLGKETAAASLAGQDGGRDDSDRSGTLVAVEDLSQKVVIVVVTSGCSGIGSDNNECVRGGSHDQRVREAADWVLDGAVCGSRRFERCGWIEAERTLRVGTKDAA